MKFKKIVALTIALAITTSYISNVEISAVENTNIPMDSLKGYWSFENYEGSIINDDSNNGKYATIMGNSTIVNEGKNNKGLKLTGEKGTFLSIPSIFNLSKENVSVSFWIKISPESGSNRSQNTILLQQEGSGRSIMYYSTSVQNDKLGSYVGGSNIYSNDRLSQDQWINVSMISNYEKKEIKFYINGKFDSKHSISAFPNSNDPLRLGDHKNNDGFALNGIVDEVMIFDRNLTDSEIRNIYYENAAIEELKNDLISVISKSKDIYKLANGIIDNTSLINFMEKIEGAESLLENESGIAKEYGENILLLENLNIEITNKINSSIGDKVLIKADVNNVFRKINTALFGANHRYHKDGYGSYDIENLKIKDEFDKLYNESNFGSVRYPGGKVANLFEWKKSIGDISQRKYTIHGDPQQQPEFPYFGVDEAVKYAEEKNSEFAYVYGMGNGNKNDAADLVEYLNCEVGENPNGGIDWAAVRAENGRIEPYNVTHFELGNEFQLTSEQAYWTTASSDPLGAYIDGGEFQFNNQFVVEEEDWRNSTAGKSNGTSNQEKKIRYYPIVEDTLILTVGGETWQKVQSLEGQGAKNVFIYDNETGKITFGNGINGNIPATGTDIKISYRAHRDGFVDYYEEMKNIDPNIEIYSCYDTENFITRMGTDKQYDGIVTHPYSGTINSNDPNYYEKILYRAEEKVGVAQAYENKINEVLGEEKAKDVKVVVSEYGIFNDSSRFVKSQVNALYTAKSLIGFADIKSIPYTTNHCLVDFPGGDLLGPGGQAIIQSIVNPTTGEIDFVATPKAKVFTLFNNLTGTNLLNESIINNKDLGNNLQSIDAMITTDIDGNLYLMLVNSSKEVTDIKVSVDGFDFFGKTGKVMVVDGPSYDAENTVDNKENVVVEESEITLVDTTELEYSLTPHSVTAIKINNDENGNIEVDKSGLQELVAITADLIESNYTVESWTKLVEALSLANNVIENIDVTQGEIDFAKSKLQEAINALEEKGIEEVFTTHLEIAVEEGKRITEEELLNIVTAVIKEFKAALAEAEELLNSEHSTQEQINSSFDRLSKAMQMLQFIKGDKTHLIGLIEKIDGLDSQVYITSTWANLQNILESAKFVVGDENALVEDVSKTYTDLLRSFLELRLKPNKELLQALINKGGELDSSKYTKESWSNLEKQLKFARSVISNEEATEVEITNVEKALKSAIDGLVTNNDTNNNIAGGSTNNNSNNNSLPKTGGVPAGVVGLLGTIMASVGSLLIRKREK